MVTVVEDAGLTMMPVSVKTMLLYHAQDCGRRRRGGDRFRGIGALVTPVLAVPKVNQIIETAIAAFASASVARHAVLPAEWRANIQTP